MKRIFFIIIVFVSLMTTVCGCKSHHSVIVDRQSHHDSIVYVTRDSIVNIHDTTVITNVVKEIEQVLSTSESTTTEWWDNYTREWTDSMGRIWKETYEKGNRQSSQYDQTDHIHSLQDSLLYYKGTEQEWRMAYNHLFEDYTDAIDTKAEKITQPKKRINWIGFLIGAVIGSVLSSVLIYRKR